MASERTRNATLLDLMVLVACTAVGIALARYYLFTPTRYTPTFDSYGTLAMVPGYRHSVRWTAPGAGRSLAPLVARDWAAMLRELAIVVSLFLAAWSPALLWLRLKSPRPSRGALLLSPALAASLMSLLFIALFFATKLFETTVQGWPTFEVQAVDRAGNTIVARLDFFPDNILGQLRFWVGPAAAVVVLILLLARNRRVRLDWVDASGLAFGTMWLIVYLA